MDKIEQRTEIGKVKYQTTVADSKLSRKQWLNHAQEKALDLAIYLEKLMDLEEV